VFLTSPVASGLAQLTPVFEQFMKQILAFVAVAVLVITSAVSCLRPKLPLPLRFGYQRALAFVFVLAVV
jgi:hypothetical protein